MSWKVVLTPSCVLFPPSMYERCQLWKLPAFHRRSGFSSRSALKLDGTASLEQPESWQLAVCLVLPALLMPPRETQQLTKQ